MLQNPRQYPRRHAPSRVQCSLTGAGLPGQARLDAGRASPTGPCCASAGRPGADQRPKGAADRNGAGTRSASSVTRHVADGVTRPIGDHQPVLIWRNALDQVESSLTGRMPPNGLNTPDRVHSFRWCAYCLRSRGARTPARPLRPRRCQGPSRDQHVVSNEPAGAPHGARSPCDAGHQTAPQTRARATRGRDRFPGHGLVNE